MKDVAHHLDEKPTEQPREIFVTDPRTVAVLPVRRLDDRIHGKVRLAILTLLSRHGTVSFLTLKAATETSDGNLAIHLQKLQAAGFIEVTRAFAGRQRQTHADITPAGRSAYGAYLEELRDWLKF